MARTIPVVELDEIRAGDTLAWDREDLSDDYPASEWILTYTFINLKNKITITAVANAENFRINVAASVTAGYKPGIYKWIAKVSKSGEKYVIRGGTFEVLPDLEERDTYDTRSENKMNLDNIVAVLRGSTSREHQSYSIAGRALSLFTHDELISAKAYWQGEYNRELRAERVAQGKSGGGNVLARL